MVMCPISPAMSDLPRYTRPASTIPPPISVPIVSPTTWLAPRAAPRHHSPKIAQLASLSSVAGIPSAPATRSRSGKLTQPRLGVSSTTPVVVSSGPGDRSEEHTSELQSKSHISYAVFCLKKKKKQKKNNKLHKLHIQNTTYKHKKT